jgi:hypothetical protein
MSGEGLLGILLKSLTEKIAAEGVGFGLTTLRAWFAARQPKDLDSAEPDQCKASDITELAEMASKYFGIDSADKSRISRIMKSYPSAYWCIRDREGVIQAYFVILMLSKDGELALQKGLFNGRDPQPEYLTKKHSTNCACYLGAIAGNSRASRAAALLTCHAVLKQLNCKTVYANIFTADGKNTAIRRGFVALDGGKPEIGKLAKKSL